MSVLTGLRAKATKLALPMAVCAAMALPASADTLADALTASYRNSNLLEQNRALLRAADEDVEQAVAALYPVLTFAMTALADSQNAPDYRISASLSATIPLIDFGRGRMSVEASREAVLATRAALVAVEQNVLNGAVQSYMGLYSDLQTLQLQRNNVSLISQQLRAARERYELGDSTRTEVALAEARLAAARSALAAAEGDVAIAREQYNLAVGQYPHGVAAPPRLPRLPASLAEAQETARRNHPSVEQAQHLVTVADLGTDIARTQRYGTVTGSLSASRTRQNVPPLPTTRTNDATASVTYSVPIYNHGRLNSVERQAVAQGEAQRSALHQTMATVQQAVAASWAQLQIARASISAADEQIRAAQAAYEAVRAEADLGSSTTLDVLDAEQDLLDARSTRIMAAANVQLAAYSLLSATGQLTVEALGLGIPTYDVEAYSAGIRANGQGRTPSEQGSRLDAIMDRYRVTRDR